MKYKLSLRRFWWSYFKSDIIRLYYKYRWGFNMGGFDGTMLPSTGKGRFVSVYSKGQIIQIVNEKGNENLGCFHNEVRIIPFQPNHGILVEILKDGKLVSRNHLDIEQLNKGIIFASNVEQLSRQK